MSDVICTLIVCLTVFIIFYSISHEIRDILKAIHKRISPRSPDDDKTFDDKQNKVIKIPPDMTGIDIDD